MKKDLITINSRGKVSRKFVFGAIKLADLMKKIMEYAFKIEQGK